LKNTNLKLKIVLIVVISLSFGILLPNSSIYSQNQLKLYEDIGGGTTNQQTDNSDNSVLYIVGGLIVVGIAAYFILTRNRNNDSEESESSTIIKTSNTPVFTSEFNDFEHEVAKAKDNLPVDFMIGIRHNKAFISDKTYLMGVSVRF